MLEVENLVTGYGRSTVLRGVSLSVEDDGFVGLLGPNGAGKSTLVKAVSGLIPCRGGSIRFDGAALSGLRAQDIVRRGLLQVPQGRLLFPDLTVQENLEMGAYLVRGTENILVRMKEVHDLFPILGRRKNQRAGVLSGGEQQMLAIGRALMSRPRLLVMDEPSIGLAPKIVTEIFEIIRRINSGGTAVLLVEQNARRVLRLAKRCVVLESGRVAASGTNSELLASEVVQKSYLGMM